MNNKKNYTTPFWWTVFILLLQAGFTLFSFLALKRVMHTENIFVKEQIAQVIRNNLIWGGTVGVVLLAEAVTYWIIRKKMDGKYWVWGHLGGLLLAFVLLPLLYIVYTAFLAANGNAAEHRTRLNMVNDIREVTFWAAVTIAHLCFVYVIIRAFKKQPPSEPTIDGSGDILSDYAEQK